MNECVYLSYKLRPFTQIFVSLYSFNCFPSWIGTFSILSQTVTVSFYSLFLCCVIPLFPLSIKPSNSPSQDFMSISWKDFSFFQTEYLFIYRLTWFTFNFFPLLHTCYGYTFLFIYEKRSCLFYFHFLLQIFYHSRNYNKNCKPFNGERTNDVEMRERESVDR